MTLLFSDYILSSSLEEFNGHSQVNLSEINFDMFLQLFKELKNKQKFELKIEIYEETLEREEPYYSCNVYQKDYWTVEENEGITDRILFGVDYLSDLNTNNFSIKTSGLKEIVLKDID